METTELEAKQRQWLKLDARERIQTALEELPEKPVLTSSFGAQSIVLLSLVYEVAPEVPVWVIDTGYLFPETYRYIDEICNRFNFNLRLIRPELSTAWLETRFGELWSGDKNDIERYNDIVKVQPLKKALQQEQVRCWFSGLRWQQSLERAQRQVVELQNEIYKVHPIIDWSDERVQQHIRAHKLPEHPLVKEGYASIGDWHSSAPTKEDGNAAQSRFRGLVRECGIHNNW